MMRRRVFAGKANRHSRTPTDISLVSPVKTYTYRGTAKPDVRPNQHAIIYTTEKPELLEGEKELIKKPLRMLPDTPRERLDRASRIDFGSPVTVQHNLKIKYHGKIYKKHMHRLKDYYNFENHVDEGHGYIDTDYSEDEEEHKPRLISTDQAVTTLSSSRTTERPPQRPLPPTHVYGSDQASPFSSRPYDIAQRRSSNENSGFSRSYQERRVDSNRGGATAYGHSDRGREPRSRRH
jgi:hypothetical protein